MFRPICVGLLPCTCTCGGTPGPDGECTDRHGKLLTFQRRATCQVKPSTAPPIVHEALNLPSCPLDLATRAFMEAWFGHGFGRVRVHTDAKAAESARAVNARAYTVGRDVVFGVGQILPDTPSGMRLLAHELAHVVQQRGGHARSADALDLSMPDDAYEREADAISEGVMSSGHPVSSAAQVGLPRLQGSFWSTVVDVLTFPFAAIYRLLGGESYNRETSHDRYANIEVSYLLQRMEAYRGLAILTTNMKNALDTAFLRRIRFIVQFPFPDAEQRAEIWPRIFRSTRRPRDWI